MNLTIDPETEQRIQRQVELGNYPDAAAVIAHAITLLEAEAAWLQRKQAAITQRLEESTPQVEPGKGYTPAQLRAILAERRAAREQ
jgi:Arc/MetJ-type ribon-helix-helix transcriptional regulator